MYGDTTPVSDATLLPLGIHRLEIPVPFVEAGGPANVYVIEDADGRWSSGPMSHEGRGEVKVTASAVNRHGRTCEGSHP